MLAWVETRRYDISTDTDVVRLSMADDQGAEYWMEIPSANGKQWRERRDAALDDIAEAIAQGLPPGQVHVITDRKAA